MASVTILQLPQATGLSGNEQIEGVQNNASVRIPLSAIAAQFPKPGPPGPQGPVGPPSLPAASAAGQVPVSNSTVQGDVTFQLLPLSVIPGAAYNGITNDTAALSTYINSVPPTTRLNATIVGPMLLSTVTIPTNVQLTFIGNGLLKPAANATITINGPIVAGAWQIFDVSALGSVVTGTPDIPFCHAAWFGAVADGVTDSTAGLQAIAKLAADAGYIRIYLAAGTYKITSTVYANGANAQSFYAPTWIGVEAWQGTLIDGSALGAGVPAFKYRGSSGRKQSGYIEAVGFKGVSGSTVGIMVQGLGGLRIRRCQFFSQQDAVMLHNEESGSFTEYVTMEDCGVNPSCTTVLHYKVTSGNNSFHGSGITGRSVITASVTGPVVQVDTGSNVYNAPFNAQVFVQNSVTLFQNNNVSLPQPLGFAGEITVEMSGGVLTLGSGARTYFAGPIRANSLTNATGANVLGGRLTRVETMGVYPDGSYSYTGAKTNQLVNLTTGATTLSSLIASVSRFVGINISASNYNYRYILSVDADGSGGSGYVAIVATLRTFNTAGYGAPTFTVDVNGNLIVTNANYPASGVTAYVSESQLSAGIQGGGHMQF